MTKFAIRHDNGEFEGEQLPIVWSRVSPGEVCTLEGGWPFDHLQVKIPFLDWRGRRSEKWSRVVEVDDATLD